MSLLRLNNLNSQTVPTEERVMVCVSTSPSSATLIEAAKKIADGLGGQWVAVHVEKSGYLPSLRADREQLAKNLRLAEELGAEVVTILGDDIVDDLLSFAKKRGITQIVIGKPVPAGFLGSYRGSVVDRIIEKSHQVSVHIIPGGIKQVKDSVGGYVKERIKNFLPIAQKHPVSFLPYSWGLLMMMLMTIFLSPGKDFLGSVNITLIYLVPVLICAVRWGTLPAIVTAAGGVLMLDFVFIAPAYALATPDVRHIISFGIFILVGLITGTLSTELMKQVEYSQKKEARVSALYALSRDIAAVSDLESVLTSITGNISDTVDSHVIILLPGDDGLLEVKACSKGEAETPLSEKERAVANGVYEKGRSAVKNTEMGDDTQVLYLPLVIEQGIQGVMVVWPNHPNHPFQSEQLRMLEAYAGLSAIALHRVKLTAQANEAQALVESERLRNALFNSLSHDLRTPLASIIGAVTGLLDGDEIYTPSARRDLLQTIHQGALRMNRFVSNLLDMAKLESGMLQLKKEWCDIQDIIGVVVGRLEPLSSGSRPLQIYIEPKLPLVKADFILIEQVLINLLDNAQKYSEPGSDVTITVRRLSKQLLVSMENRGKPLPETDLVKIFDKFYRLKTPMRVSGTGLGLSICKAFIQAHGGEIWAENVANGLCIRFVLPIDDEITMNSLDAGDCDER